MDIIFLSQASNFSIGNLFTQYDLSTKPAVTADEETRFSADVSFFLFANLTNIFNK